MRIPSLRAAGLPGLLTAALALGFILLPAVIYLAGSSILGRYEGARIGIQYDSIYRGLGHGNLASWTVVLGPALLILLARGLKPLWNAGKTPTS